MKIEDVTIAGYIDDFHIHIGRIKNIYALMKEHMVVKA